MMTIGEFATTTGLSAKALRFYDEKGLLTPRDVDPATGYRRYGSGQVRQAATIKLLRDLGMPLADVRVAIHETDQVDRLVADFRTRLTAERERQDRALRVAEKLLPAYGRDHSVERRHAARQDWVGAVLPLDVEQLEDPDALEETNSGADEVFGRLYLALVERGLRPTGPFWTTLGSSLVDADSEIVLCWPIDEPGDRLDDLTGIDDARVVGGVLPEREELVGRCDLADDPEVIASGAAMPGVVAFMEAREEFGVDDREVRQVGVLGPDGTPVAMELTTTLRPNSVVYERNRSIPGGPVP